MRSLRILSADDRGADTVGIDHIGRARQDGLHIILARQFLLNIAARQDGDRRGRVLHVALHFFAGDDDRAQNGHVILGPDGCGAQGRDVACGDPGGGGGLAPWPVIPAKAGIQLST